ncbi:MAG: hypothetical protein L0387_32115 [Acidobacteria bacterium]|nr:hypothetical protein [Acidobacteriota bacterium]MCI0626239.1 hypothetical protein [Acidobacteriota bacterium]MCI0724104.1 hypothetical protein [Acidobacteriota bacterium]
MTAERWQKVEELFHLGLEREAGQRAAFLDEACAGDPDLRGKVESLLAYDEQESDFLETPASEVRGGEAQHGDRPSRGAARPRPPAHACLGERDPRGPARKTSPLFGW